MSEAYSLLHGPGVGAVGKNIPISWDRLTARLAKPKRSLVSVAEYHAMTKREKGGIKSAAGWLCNGPSAGICREGHRCNKCITSHIALPLDFDAAPPDWRAGIAASGLHGFWHTTCSHTPESPRVRVWIPLTKPIQSERLRDVMLHLASRLGCGDLDPACFKASQPAFLPVVLVDGEFDSGCF